MVKIEDLFDYEGRKLKAVIKTETPLLDPFTTLEVIIFDDGEKILSFETIFKCDIYEGCRFCFSSDYKHIYFEKGRKRRYIPAVWEGCLTFRGIPIEAEKFYEECILSDKVIFVRDGSVKVLTGFEGIDFEVDGDVVKVSLRNGEYFVRRCIIK